MARLNAGESRNTALLSELASVGEVAASEAKQAAHVTGASDDTTKRQRTLAADLVHFVGEEGVRRTLCIGLSCMSRGTAASKAEHFERRVDQVREAAKLSVPTIHGAKEALDRVTLQYLITSWDSMTLEVKIAPEPPSPPHQQRLLELEQRSAESVRGEDGSAIAQMTPWDRLIWEVAKLCCMNARKMNVALGQDLHERAAGRCPRV